MLHIHCASYTTGKGAITSSPTDPSNFEVQSIDLGGTWDRYRWGPRIRQERRYGAEFVRLASAFDPDLVISCNDPLFAKSRSVSWFRRSDTPWLFWLQDLYSVAMAEQAVRKLRALGRPLGWAFQSLERRALREATEVVAITDDFLPLLESWQVPHERCTVIENWAPLPEISVRRQDNQWSRARGLAGKQVVLYSGTLGLKHNPQAILDVALANRDNPDVAVVVVSEGLGSAWLSRRVVDLGLTNLTVEPYQPYEHLPDVLATATVLLALLERGAGGYSVPSKLLTYLCAGRPIVAAMPAENLGARLIERAGAGVVVPPEDGFAVVAAIRTVLEDPAGAAARGQRARAYAEREFDIDDITNRFEHLIDRALSRR